jgi:hypothetical protein
MSQVQLESSGDHHCAACGQTDTAAVRDEDRVPGTL